MTYSETAPLTGVGKYKKEECVLDVVLYGNNQNKRVKYTDLRDSEGKPAAVKHCYFKFRSSDG